MTRDDIIDEIREVEKDLCAFKGALDLVLVRTREQEDNEERYRMFTDWPVTVVVTNTLIIAITKCEGLLQDFHHLLDQMELPENVVPIERKKT